MNESTPFSVHLFPNPLLFLLFNAPEYIVHFICLIPGTSFSIPLEALANFLENDQVIARVSD